MRCEPICIETLAENNFMPRAIDIAPHIKHVSVVALCSPLNPTGTCISKHNLTEICDLILHENETRLTENKKPVYLLYDQIYWLLNSDGSEHCDPVSINPKMRDYTVYIHGISKVFAATGVRVGWAFGPEFIISKMKNFLGHVGAWAPKAEQVATAKFLENHNAVDQFLVQINHNINIRLKGLYAGFVTMQSEGLPIEVIAPQAAIYLTVKFDLIGKKTEEGNLINEVNDITQFLLNKAKVAVVPFYAFGASKDSTWFRLSVGTCAEADLQAILMAIKNAILTLK
jgi:aspartate aminotransferase